MDKLKSLGDEELRQQHEEKLREIFKEHNISEETGFEIANEILDYVLKLDVEKSIKNVFTNEQMDAMLMRWVLDESKNNRSKTTEEQPNSKKDLNV